MTRTLELTQEVFFDTMQKYPMPPKLTWIERAPPKRKVVSPSLAGGAKHRDFTVNHGVFITFSPIIQFSTEAIPGVAAPQPPEMDSNDFCLLC